ncbi:MAG: phosphopantetheine-binding protein, partial [Anaerolineales bacterium]
GLADAVAGQGLVPAPFKPPGTPTQRALAAIWREVLKVDRVGADDRFLDLGGDSILAAQLLARVRSRLNIELSMLDFFEAETIAEQALLVEGKNRHKAP